MTHNNILENLRVAYQAHKLDINECEKNPKAQFDKWFKEALHSECDEPNAFVLSTVFQGQPRGRVVLLKGTTDTGFVFYTNYKSAKGSEILANDKASATFLWLPLQRQVRIEGTLQKVEASVSEEYFHKRPRGSQLGAIASPQSQKVSSRAELEKMFSDTEKRYEKVEVLPRPENWGGYVLIPSYFEFWQGRDNRMHDRICYVKQGAGWDLQRLAP